MQKNLKWGLDERICTPMLIAEKFTVVKKKEASQVCQSTDKWINKMKYIHTMEYYSALKKNEILPYMTTRMNLKDIMLSEISQTSQRTNTA